MSSTSISWEVPGGLITWGGQEQYNSSSSSSSNLNSKGFCEDHSQSFEQQYAVSAHAV
jgi:hypothetical protein